MKPPAMTLDTDPQDPSRVVRAGLTQTRNAFADMPRSVAELGGLAGRLEQVRAANVAHHVELVRRAAGHGVRVLGFGELCTGPYFALDENPLWFALAEDARSGPTVTELAQVARAHAIVLVVPLYELDRASGKRFNTAVVIDADGLVLGGYRKTHVPRGSNEQASFCETFYYERSDGRAWTGPKNVSAEPFFPVFRTQVGRVGVAICYDRHFEGVMAALARGGAEIVFSPAVTFGAKSRRLWELEFAVDAARHRLYIGGSNRQGSEPPWTTEYFGASGFWGPEGSRLPSIASDTPELVVSDLDLRALTAPDGSGWNLARDARPEIHGNP